MRIRTTLAAVSLLLPLAGVTALGPGTSCVPGGTTSDDQQIDLCTLETYLQCAGDETAKAHLDNVDGAVELDTAAPAASVQAGAGCGRTATPVADPGQLPAEEVLRVTGSITGNVAAVAVELHILGPGVGQTGESVSVPLTLTIGEVTVVDDVVEAEVVPSETKASVGLRFSFPVSGLAGEAGPGTTARDLVLVAGYPNLGACQTIPVGSGCAPAGAYTYVWGTTEVPAGITINPA